MQCPFCREMESRVVDSRLAAGGTVTWRRRECDSCQKRFTTYERVEHTLPTVVKKDGEREPFDRQKVLRSLQIACNKRPVPADTLEAHAEALERGSVLRLGEVPVRDRSAGLAGNLCGQVAERPRVVAGELLQPRRADGAEQPDRVVADGFPRVGIDCGEDVLGLGVPGPAQVPGQIRERVQRLGQDGLDGESANRSHGSTVTDFDLNDPISVSLVWT